MEHKEVTRVKELPASLSFLEALADALEATDYYLNKEEDRLEVARKLKDTALFFHGVWDGVGRCNHASDADKIIEEIKKMRHRDSIKEMQDKPPVVIYSTPICTRPHMDQPYWYWHGNTTSEDVSGPIKKYGTENY